MTTRVWEDTLIIATRDFQWRTAIRNLVGEEKGDAVLQKLDPGLLLKLDGNSESLSGDVAISLDDIYYLIEFKGGYGEIGSEWKEKVKYLYLFLSAICKIKNICVKKSDDERILEKMIFASIRAHHVAFWKKEFDTEIPHVSVGQISALPYILGMQEMSAGVDERYAIKDCGFERLSSDDASLEMVLSNTSAVPVKSKTTQIETDAVAGLPLDGMLQYVEWLQQGSHFQDTSLKVALYNGRSQLVCATSSLSSVLSKLHLLRAQLAPKPKRSPGMRGSGTPSASTEPKRDVTSVIPEQQLERSIFLAKTAHGEANRLRQSILSAIAAKAKIRKDAPHGEAPRSREKDDTEE